MRHRHHHHKLGRPSGHRRALLRNMASSLIMNGSIQTTQAKARALRPYAERLITLARRGDQSSRRLAFARLGDKRAVTRLFEEIGPIHRDRAGGYTRITKIGRRGAYGDAAEMAVIEILGGEGGKAKPLPKHRKAEAEATE